MNEDILYTPEEIAQKLKITKGTVYEMIKRGDLDAHKIGKHLRISSSQFEVYLLKSKGFGNNFEVNIIEKEDEKFGNINNVNLHINTELEGRAKISIRPEDIILSKEALISSARNVHKGIVTDVIIDGSSSKVIVDIGISLVVLITKKSLIEMEIEKGITIYTVFKTMSVKVYK